MSFTRTSLLRTLRFGAGALLVTIVVAYALWRSFAYARGPRIVIDTPTNWSSTSSPIITVDGHVERANNVTLNGKAMSMDEEGNFNESLILFPGTNVITIEAHDQFERSVQTELRLQKI